MVLVSILASLLLIPPLVGICHLHSLLVVPRLQDWLLRFALEVPVSASMPGTCVNGESREKSNYMYK